MGQMARLRLICDIFIAGHSSCELWRYLDSIPADTPIRDVVDRCCIWESHADPAVRRVSKPSTDPIHMAYVVEDSDNISKTKRWWRLPGRNLVRTSWRTCYDDCWRPQLPRLRSQLWFRRCQQWRNYCIIWWRRHRVVRRR